jgi:hypothetical protein
MMGWTSTSDPLENVGRASLLFHTKEEAIMFCQKHGWEAQVGGPSESAMPLCGHMHTDARLQVCPNCVTGKVTVWPPGGLVL